MTPLSSEAPAAGDELLAALDATVAAARGSTLYRERLADVRVRSLDDLRRLPFTTRADLQRAGLHGTRAAPLTQVCHYQESSGTTGAVNSAWLTAGDLLRSARAIRAALPDVFAPGKIVLNRFPFMSAPAHLIQLIAQEGGGVVIPAGNINWDVPFPRALEMTQRLGVQVLASMPMEPAVLGELARAQGIDPARDLAVETLFLGGSPLPPALQRTLARMWDARVVELYGSTETMLLGTSCAHGTLHLETELAYCEILDPETRAPVGPGGQGNLVVTTLGLEGSPLVRLDTGDVVRLAAGPCPCGSPRPGGVVLGRAADVVEMGGRRLFPYEVIDVAAQAAETLGSAVFFVVVLPSRLLIRIEARTDDAGPALALARQLLGSVPVEVELVPPGYLLSVDTLSRSPKVYKPVVMSDWRRAPRKILTVMEGMIEWPRPPMVEIRRAIAAAWAAFRRRRQLARELRVAGPSNR